MGQESSKPFLLVSSTCDISLMIYCNLDDENCCCYVVKLNKPFAEKHQRVRWVKISGIFERTYDGDE